MFELSNSYSRCLLAVLTSSSSPSSPSNGRLVFSLLPSLPSIFETPVTPVTPETPVVWSPCLLPSSLGVRVPPTPEAATVNDIGVCVVRLEGEVKVCEI